MLPRGSSTNGAANEDSQNLEFDPISEKKNENLTSDIGTFIHLIKASLGTGILAMPFVFKQTGLLCGAIVTIVTSLICSHCSYILITSAHILYKRTEKTKMTFGEVAENAFATGPKKIRRFAPFARYFVSISLFVTYFGSGTVYAVLIGDNTKQVYEYYTNQTADIRICILIFLIPLICLSLIRNLKYLVPVSMMANVCMMISLGITFFYIFCGLPTISDLPLVNDFKKDLKILPSSIATVIFAVEAVGSVLQLENEMKTPRNFIGIFGVFSKGMILITILHFFVGFFAYWRYGDETHENITLNLPVNEIPAQIDKIFTGLSVLLSFSLNHYVCIEILWDATKKYFTKTKTIAHYIQSVLIVICVVGVAIALPDIEPLLQLVGAFGFSCLGFIAPVVIETVIMYEEGYSRNNWFFYFKNVICLLFGIFALIFGTWSAIDGIVTNQLSHEMEPPPIIYL